MARANCSGNDGVVTGVAASGPIVVRYRSQKLIRFVLLMVMIAVAVVTALLTLRSQHQPPRQSPKPMVFSISAPTPLVGFAVEPKTLAELLALAPEQLARVDIARMNLLCATGLPGAERLDIEHALATLDHWAQRVASETDRHLYRVTDPRYADHYRHSEARLRAEMLPQVLQLDLGVKYDMTSADNFAFNDSRVAFIHGMIPAVNQTIADTPGGTCASMPVMYVAVGRRLGYPLTLVTTNSHIFVRWDGQLHSNPAWRERFNIEGAGEGFGSFEDDYYQTWPYKISDDEVRMNGYLLSLTPAEELAGFLASRGHCALDNGQTGFAARCFENAYRYDPRRPCYRAWFADAALRSGYRSSTPNLASLNTQQTRPAVVRHSMSDLGTLPPTVSSTWAPAVPSVSNAQRLDPWQPQTNLHSMPGIPTTASTTEQQSIFSERPTRSSP